MTIVICVPWILVTLATVADILQSVAMTAINVPMILVILMPVVPTLSFHVTRYPKKKTNKCFR